MPGCAGRCWLLVFVLTACAVSGYHAVAVLMCSRSQRQLNNDREEAVAAMADVPHVGVDVFGLTFPWVMAV